MAKILFFGDIMGKPGRQALSRVLPGLREEYSPDLVVANVENLAHGKGVTPSTLQELKDLKVDVFTSGNHVFDKGAQSDAGFEQFENLIRPINYEGQFPGHGHYRLAVGDQQFLILNLNGQVFFEKQFGSPISNPFFAADGLLTEHAQKGDIILVDLHAEATSEKIAMGWYLDGRVAALFGTHTHVPTADAWVMPKGTAYVTDAGMCGAKYSVIGAKRELSLHAFLEKGKFVLDPADEGPLVVNGVYVETNGSEAIKIEKIFREVAQIDT